MDRNVRGGCSSQFLTQFLKSNGVALKAIARMPYDTTMILRIALLNDAFPSMVQLVESFCSYIRCSI